jgi:hypothetical protein
MKTSELAVYLIAFVAVVAVLFGLVPPLLNAKSTALNAVGAAVTVATILAAILTGHAVHTKNKKGED